jgi:hypothetical protein
MVDPGEECDDGNNNNNDSCRDNCLRPCGNDECVCSLLSTVLPKFSVSGKIPPGADDDALTFKINLPKLGKGVGTSFNMEYSAEGQIADCGNGCESSFKASLGGKWEAEVLTEKVEAAISGGVDISSKHCLLCDPQTCQESCGDRYCLTTGGNGSASLAYTKTIPLFPLKAFSWGPVRGRIGCDVSGTVGLSLGGSVAGDEPGTATLCENCGECETFSATLGGTIGGGLACGLGLNAGGVNASAMITGSVSISPEFKVDLARGEDCENPGICSHAKISGAVNGAGTACVNLRFFQAKAECKISYSGFKEAGCEGFMSMSDGPKYGCTVSATVLGGDCLKKCEKFCDRGLACGDDCLPSNSPVPCDKSPGTACDGTDPELDE